MIQEQDLQGLIFNVVGTTRNYLIDLDNTITNPTCEKVDNTTWSIGELLVELNSSYSCWKVLNRTLNYQIY